MKSKQFYQFQKFSSHFNRIALSAAAENDWGERTSNKGAKLAVGTRNSRGQGCAVDISD